METIATLYEHQAMVDGPKLPARTSNVKTAQNSSLLLRDTISESLSDFPQKNQTPVEELWSLRSIDLRVIALHPSFVKLRMPQNASLVPLISEPIRVNVISFVIYKRGNSQYPEQLQ